MASRRTVSNRFSWSIRALLPLCLLTPAPAAGQAPPTPTLVTPVFLGGLNRDPQLGLRESVGQSRPGSLLVSEVDSAVGWIKEVRELGFSRPQSPFGQAKQLQWTGSAEASFSFQFRGLAPPQLARRANRGFLVFNLRVTSETRTDLRVGIRCAGVVFHCLTEVTLTTEDLPAREVWQTFRIPVHPLPQFTVRPGLSHDSKELPHQGGQSVISFRTRGATPMTLELASVRLEKYASGWSFAESRASDLLPEMTLAEKVGQMIMVTIDASPDFFPSAMAQFGLGATLMGGGAVPVDGERNSLDRTVESFAASFDAFQRGALATRLAIPALNGWDSVHGASNSSGTTVFPHQIGLGATRNSDLVRRIGEITARESRAGGANLAFSPVLDVARDQRWGRTYESFSEDPEIVTRMTSLIDGLQGTSGAGAAEVLGPQGVLATAKHYPGGGSTDFQLPDVCRVAAAQCPGFHQMTTLDGRDSTLSEQDLRAIHLQPFQEAVRRAVGLVMVGYSGWNGLEAHAHRFLITDLLKGELGFQGVVLSDWDGDGEVDPASPRDGAIEVVEAGIDLLMLPFLEEVSGVTQALMTQVPETRIDDAVHRILQAKFRAGLFDIPFSQPGLRSTARSEGHLQTARQAVRESLVLLKNDAATLPLAPSRKIYLAGKAADNLGILLGGWSLTWQGVIDPEDQRRPTGTTIRQGLERLLGADDVIFSPDGSLPLAGAEAGIVVVGEYPYAEGCGDIENRVWWCPFAKPPPTPGSVVVTETRPPGFEAGLSTLLPPSHSMSLETDRFTHVFPSGVFASSPVEADYLIDPDSDSRLVDRVCSAVHAAGNPCVVILVSGRPLFVDQEIAQADAFVAAWLPGSEGGDGIAQLLLQDCEGEVAAGDCDFTGTLSHTWPARPEGSDSPALDYRPQNIFVGQNGSLDRVLEVNGQPLLVGYGLSYDGPIRRD